MALPSAGSFVVPTALISKFAPCPPGLTRVGIDCVPASPRGELTQTAPGVTSLYDQFKSGNFIEPPIALWNNPAYIPPPPPAPPRPSGGDPNPPPVNCPAGTRLEGGRCVEDLIALHPPGLPPRPPPVVLPPNSGTNMPPATYNQLTVGGVVGGLTGADACSALPASYQAACRIALGLASAVVGGPSNANLASNCPTGWTWNATLGRCIAPQNAFPGGQPLTLGGTGVATTGGLGLSAITPTQVGTISRSDGTTGPILKCPRRYVLGQDYLCYPKSLIPNQLRAHPRGTRPLLTGGEVKILRRAKGLAKKVGKLGTQFGPKVCHCGTKPTRRKK